MRCHEAGRGGLELTCLAVLAGFCWKLGPQMCQCPEPGKAACPGLLWRAAVQGCSADPRAPLAEPLTCLSPAWLVPAPEFRGPWNQEGGCVSRRGAGTVRCSLEGEATGVSPQLSRGLGQ